MSYLIIDISAEYTDRATGNRQIRAEIIADSVSDLPENTTALTYLLGTHARTVDTGDIYYIDSSGTWIQQPPPNQLDLTGYYTSAETDTLLAGKQDSLTQTQLDTIDNTTIALPEIINAGAKNITEITLSAGTYTSNGIDYTVNNDQSEVTATNTASSTSYIILQTLQIKAGTYVVSGCPSGGGDAVYKIRLGDADNANAYITQDIGNSQEFTLARDYNMYVMIYVFPAAGNVDLTFRPMICKKSDYDISPEYTPYCPSLYELYQLVKSYHP